MGDDAAVETEDDDTTAGEDGKPRWIGLTS
jgi:hypothetical protein